MSPNHDMNNDHNDPVSPAGGAAQEGDLGRANGHRIHHAEVQQAYCLIEGIQALTPGIPPPWAPGRREEVTDVERAARASDPRWCMSDVDVFADLSPAEMAAFAAATPTKTYAAGELLFSPHSPVETLFVLKKGRVRIFQVSGDGRAVTSALLTPGTIFGEMALIGQRMHDNFAEALDEVVVCLMSRADVRRFMLEDPRVAARLTEILGRRLAELERRLTESVVKNVPQRIAGTLCLLAEGQRQRPLNRGVQVVLTHEQIAALAGTSRETATKVLGEFADRGLVRLTRGRVTLLQPEAIAAEAGD